MMVVPRPLRAIRVLAWLALGVVVLGSTGAYSQQAMPAQNPLRIAAVARPPLLLPAGNGYLDSILAEMFKRAGLGYQIILTPPRRGLLDTNSGIFDATIVPSPEVPPDFLNLKLLPEALIRAELSGLYARDDIVLSSVEDFFDYRIAFLNGWKLPSELFKSHEEAEQVRDSMILMNLLAQDRVDVVFFSTVPGQYIARQLGMTDIKVSDFRLPRQLYLHLHKHHAELIPLLETHLQAMKTDGTMDALLEGYAPGY